MTEKVKYLECPCCGDVGATANGQDLWFRDGDRLECGCPGHVTVDEDDVYICAYDDEHCPRCEAEAKADDEYFRSGTRYPGQ
jgi:hypothetical protein